MAECMFCKKQVLLKFIMNVYNLKATEIAQAIHVSDSLVRKHIEGHRYCKLVDIYIITRCFGLSVKESKNND